MKKQLILKKNLSQKIKFKKVLESFLTISTQDLNNKTKHPIHCFKDCLVIEAQKNSFKRQSMNMKPLSFLLFLFSVFAKGFC